MMSLKGRIVPPTGGREYPVDCQMVFNVSVCSRVLSCLVMNADRRCKTLCVQPCLAAAPCPALDVAERQQENAGQSPPGCAVHTALWH